LIDKSGQSYIYPEDGHALYADVEHESFWFRHRKDIVKILAEKYLNPGSTFADVGGGTGFIANALQSNFEVTLIEPNTAACKKAAERGVKNILPKTIAEAGIEHSAFKGIGMFDVVEHFEDDLKLLKEVKTASKKDGFLFVSVPAFQKLWSEEDARAGHFRRYTKTSLSEKVTQAGFEVVYVSYLFWFLPFPIYLMRVLKGEQGVAKSTDYKTSKAMLFVLDAALSIEKLLAKIAVSSFIGSSVILVAKNK